MSTMHVPKKPVTIRDLANALRMPISTVGNILRDDPRYSDELRNQVMHMAKKMGYRRNVLASGLRGGKTNTVGILWSFGGFDVGGVISDLVSECYARGYSTLLCESLSDVPLMEEKLGDFLVRQVDAVVFQWGYTMEVPRQLIEQLQRFELVVVVSVGPVSFPCRNIVLSVDKGLEEAGERMLAQGRTKPAVLISRASNEHKVQAFLRPFVRRGLVGEPLPIHDIGRTAASEVMVYYNMLNILFRRRKFEYDCLFCGVDEGAMAAIRWLQERKLRVPEDVAVVGFNDSQFTRMTTPSITSIRRPNEKLVAEILRLLFVEPERKVIQRRIDYELMVRESTL